LYVPMMAHNLRLLTANSEPLVSQCSNPRPGGLRNPALAQ